MLIKDGKTEKCYIDSIVFSNFLMEIDSSFSDEIFLKSVETLHLLCEIKPNRSKAICAWALRTLSKKYGNANQKNLSQGPLALYSLAMLSNDLHVEKLSSLIAKVQAELTEINDWWFAYKLVRQAFRYGHFSTIALPLLERIHPNVTF